MAMQRSMSFALFSFNDCISEHVLIDMVLVNCCQTPRAMYLWDSCQNPFLQFYNAYNCVAVALQEVAFCVRALLQQFH